MTASGSQGAPFRGAGKLASFEDLLLPHLNAAYNLARWLTRNDQNANDLVQDAYLRAWKSFGGFNGGDGRAWLLTIVRNTCYTAQRNRASELMTSFDEEMHSTSSHASNQKRYYFRVLTVTFSRRPCKDCQQSSAKLCSCGRSKVCPIERSRAFLEFR
jgi:RNA polymerase sigma factor (sigma-70 family)